MDEELLFLNSLLCSIRTANISSVSVIIASFSVTVPSVNSFVVGNPSLNRILSINNEHVGTYNLKCE